MYYTYTVRSLNVVSLTLQDYRKQHVCMHDFPIASVSGKPVIRARKVFVRKVAALITCHRNYMFLWARARGGGVWVWGDTALLRYMFYSESTENAEFNP